MADELGAARGTPRPTGDLQTPETAAQLPRGATNTVSPVSGDHQDVSSRISSQGEPAFEAATLAVLEALNPMGDDPVYPTRSTEFAAYVAEQVEQALIGAGWRRPRPDHEAALAALRAAILENPESISFAGPECDMEAYAALPPCTACEGGGQDTHGTVFEAPLAVHFAGPYVTTGGRRRQLCAWCGHVLLDVQLAPGQEHEPWFDVKLVRVEDGATTRQPYTYGDPLPPGCCALPDDEDQAPAEQSAPPAPNPWVRCPNTPPCEHPSLIHDVSGDPEDPKPMCCADGCRCGQPDDGPDDAQETHAAADWPAEESDRG